MSQNNKYAIRCHDAGSTWCPCALGKAGYCQVCPVINGDETCDFCLWSGTCVYDHHFRHRGPIRVREFVSTPVRSRQVMGHDLYLVRLELPGGWETECKRPGSFVMVKGANDEDTSAAPMAVCDVDSEEQTLTIAFQIRGPKTLALVCAEDEWALKGPYHGALFGVRRLLRAFGQKVLILVSSTGQSLISGVVRNLLEQENDISIAIDPGLSGGLYILDNLKGFDGRVLATRFYDTVTHEDLGRLSEIIGASGADLVITLGSDFLHRDVVQLLESKQEWVASNNSIMVCAEGLCGSCSIVLRDGTEIRGCKADIAPEDVFWRDTDRAARRKEG